MRIQFLHDVYWKCHSLYWKTYALVAPVAATKRRYRKCMGCTPDLKDPKTLNEKMQYLKLHDYWKKPIISECTDKYAVREYVTAKGCAEILNELYAVYNKVEEIDWECLPQEFVLKCNHGSGGNIICHDKSSLDIEGAKKKLKKWMKDDFVFSVSSIAIAELKERFFVRSSSVRKMGNHQRITRFSVPMESRNFSMLQVIGTKIERNLTISHLNGNGYP